MISIYTLEVYLNPRVRTSTGQLGTLWDGYYTRYTCVLGTLYILVNY